MKLKIVILLLCCLFLFTGCQQGEYKSGLVIEGQPAPFDGWNFGPDSFVLKGQPAKVTGFLFYVPWLDPNDLLGE